MCQADFLSDRNPWWLRGYKSQWSCCYRAPISCLAGEVRVGKKHVFGSSVGRRGGRLPNSCLRVGSPDTFTEIMALFCYM